jgi:hypothetical protein
MNILSTMKMKGTVGYAPNSNNRKRNQVISHVTYNSVTVDKNCFNNNNDNQ